MAGRQVRCPLCAVGPRSEVRLRGGGGLPVSPTHPPAPADPPSAPLWQRVEVLHVTQPRSHIGSVGGGQPGQPAVTPGAAHTRALAAGWRPARALASRKMSVTRHATPRCADCPPSPGTHPQPALPSLPAAAAWHPPVLLVRWEPQEGKYDMCRSGGPPGPARKSGTRAGSSSGANQRSGSALAHGWLPGMQTASQPGPASDPCGQGKYV